MSFTPPKLPPEAFLGLLTSPEGSYGRAHHGSSIAFTLRGSETFLERAQNLFDSFGGETENGPLDQRRLEYRPVTFRQGNECLYFCMPPERYERAVRTFLYGQLVKAKAVWELIVDDSDPEDPITTDRVLLNEGDLEMEAAALASSFMAHEVNPDYRGIPDYAPRNVAYMQEHSYYIAEEPVY